MLVIVVKMVVMASPWGVVVIEWKGYSHYGGDINSYGDDDCYGNECSGSGGVVSGRRR